MNAESVRRLLQKMPFYPLEVQLSSGMKYQIRHPENAMVLKNTLVIGDPETDDVTWCSMLHVASIRRVSIRSK